VEERTNFATFCPLRNQASVASLMEKRAKCRGASAGAVSWMFLLG